MYKTHKTRSRIALVKLHSSSFINFVRDFRVGEKTGQRWAWPESAGRIDAEAPIP